MRVEPWTAQARQRASAAPVEIEIDRHGVLWVTDGIGLLRRITSDAVVTTVAGTSAARGSEDGTGSGAWLDGGKFGLGVDGAGNVYVATPQTGNVRRARPAGIEDVAVTNTATPLVGATIALSTVPDTATSWQWSILRRPAGSVAELSSTTIRNPTLVPDVADRFILLLRAEGPSGLRLSTVEIDPTPKRRTRAVRR